MSHARNVALKVLVRVEQGGAFAAAALSTLNGPYPTIEHFFDRIDIMTKKLKKFSIRKAMSPR